MGVVRVMNLQRTSEGSCGSSFSGQLPAEVEIQVKEGGTSLHKTFREINLVLFHLSEHLSEPNTPRSQRVWISDFLPYFFLFSIIVMLP